MEASSEAVEESLVVTAEDLEARAEKGFRCQAQDQKAQDRPSRSDRQDQMARH